MKLDEKVDNKGTIFNGYAIGRAEMFDHVFPWSIGDSIVTAALNFVEKTGADYRQAPGRFEMKKVKIKVVW
jgi:hypothetical protein